MSNYIPAFFIQYLADRPDHHEEDYKDEEATQDWNVSGDGDGDDAESDREEVKSATLEEEARDIAAQHDRHEDQGGHEEKRSEERRVGKECRSRWSPEH